MIDFSMPPSSTETTVAIVGGGPAGMSCALWLKQLRLHPLLIETAPALGGALRNNWHRNEWVLGHAGKTGQELAAQFARHIEQEGIIPHLNTRVIAANRHDGLWRMTLETSGRQWVQDTAAIVWCGGTRYKTDEDFHAIPGYSTVAAQGHVHFGPPDAVLLDSCRGREVAVIGGGDNAFENAALLCAQGAMVHLIMRSPPHPQAWLEREVQHWQEKRQLQRHPHSAIRRFAPHPAGLALELADTEHTSAPARFLPVSAAIALLGYVPNTETLHSLFPRIACSEKNHVIVDADFRTNIAGLYAAGDIATPHTSCIPTAIAAGSVAARSVERDLRTANPIHITAHP